MIELNQKNLLKKFALQNDFNKIFKYPLVTVLRNVKLSQNSCTYVEDEGDNLCDSILLFGADRRCYLVRGRSLPHKKYQADVVAGNDEANYISYGYYPVSLRKGPHKGKEALVQNRSFIIWRSRNMRFGDADDYVDYDGFVGDNMHGNAPYSAGCITIQGKMHLKENGEEIRNGDWEFTHRWIYNINQTHTFFSVIVMGYDDVMSDDWKLMPGSSGRRVKQLQGQLGVRQDGDFGPITFHKLRLKQKQLGIRDSGIYDIHTRNAWN